MARHSKKILSVLDRATVRRIAESLQPMELALTQRNAMRMRIAGSITAQQAEPADAKPLRTAIATVAWQTCWPNVWMKVLRKNAAQNIQTVLFRILPGGIVPAHIHVEEEECLVLEGEIFIGNRRVGEGDLHIAQPGAKHKVITTRIGATLMVRSEVPLQIQNASLSPTT